MSTIERPAHFVLRSLEGEVLREYVLDKPQITIGRASTRDISVPQDKLISRRHLVVNYEYGTYVLLDEGSANGTFINGQLIEPMHPYVLTDGDEILIGRHELVFHISAIEDIPTMSVPFDELTTNEREEQQPPRDEKPLPVSLKAVSLPRDTSALSKTTASMHAMSAAQLLFTAFYPRVSTLGNWGVLLMYSHLDKAVTEVRRDAVSYRQGVDDVPRHRLSPQQFPFLSGTAVTVVPESPGMIFNPKRLTFRWTEEWHRLAFRFSMKEEWSASSGRISVFAGPLLIATLPLTIQAQDPQTPDRPSSVGDTHVTTQAYRRIFPSYSPQDATIMQACRTIYRALGFTELARIDTMRAARMDDEVLQRAISQAEIFQLFWSSQAALDETVTREWQYALQFSQSENFLRPVYWDAPMQAPPDPLRVLHFTYLPAYTFTTPQN